MKLSSNEVSNKPSKKPYESPKLLVYGDLKEMTLSRGGRGKLDGGTKLGARRTGR
jgi:hypothetical protein